MRLTLVLVAIFAALPLSAQLELTVSGASVEQYAAQLVDGGPQKWAVTVILNNPSATLSSSVNAGFFDDNGAPLSLDFGEGPVSTLHVTLPPGGTSSVTSLGSSPTISVGWARFTANNPIVSTLLYRAANMWDVAAAGTGPTYLYHSFANYALGVALVNPSSTQTIHVLISTNDTQGVSAGSANFTLGPNGHKSFNLGPSIPGMSTSFSGSMTITSADDAPTPFVAWAVNSRNNLLSPLPPGEMLSPAPPTRIANDVASRVLAVGAEVAAKIDFSSGTSGLTTGQVVQQFTSATLAIDSSPTISAAYMPDGKVHVSTAMLQALGESRAALGFVIVDLTFASIVGSGNPESDGLADLVAIYTLMQAGYDPGGAADFFYRIRYAQFEGVPVDPALVNMFAIGGGATNRLGILNTFLQQGCGGQIPGFQSDCFPVHNLWHPDYPVTVP